MLRNARSLFDQMGDDRSNRSITYTLDSFNYSTSDTGRILPKLTATRYLHEESNIYAVSGTVSYHPNSGQPINKNFKVAGIFLLTPYDRDSMVTYSPTRSDSNGQESLEGLGQIYMLDGLRDLCEDHDIDLFYTPPEHSPFNIRCCDAQIPRAVYYRNTNVFFDEKQHFIDADFHRVMDEDYMYSRKEDLDLDRLAFYETSGLKIFEDISGMLKYQGMGYLIIDFSTELAQIATMVH